MPRISPRRPFAADAHDDTALAGPDGRELARLIRDAQARGERVLAGVVRGAVGRAVRAGGVGEGLLDAGERKQVEEAIASVSGVADLMGRLRVRELADRAAKRAAGRHFSDADAPFAAVKSFADAPGVVVAPPEDALAYFLRISPLGIDPDRWLDATKDRASKLAATTDQTLTQKVHDAIREAIRGAEGADRGGDLVDAVLEAAGVDPGGDYGRMVFRTLANSSYQDAAWSEMTHPDVADEFPVWRYLGVEDIRAGEDHKPKFGRYYPASAAFAEVRGPRVYNCRCSFAGVAKDEWAELQSRGAKAETTW